MYRVLWEIDVEADSPREAAKKALEIQRDPASMATAFTVQPFGSAGRLYDGSYEIEINNPGLGD